LDGILANQTRSILIRIPPAEPKDGLFDGILDVLHKYPGADEVVLEMLLDPNIQVRVRANPALRVQHGPALVSDLKQLGCLSEAGSKPIAGKRN
jgi:hypothetical protein